MLRRHCWDGFRMRADGFPRIMLKGFRGCAVVGSVAAGIFGPRSRDPLLHVLSPTHASRMAPRNEASGSSMRYRGIRCVLCATRASESHEQGCRESVSIQLQLAEREPMRLDNQPRTADVTRDPRITGHRRRPQGCRTGRSNDPPELKAQQQQANQPRSSPVTSPTSLDPFPVSRGRSAMRRPVLPCSDPPRAVRNPRAQVWGRFVSVALLRKIGDRDSRWTRRGKKMKDTSNNSQYGVLRR